MRLSSFPIVQEALEDFTGIYRCELRKNRIGLNISAIEFFCQKIWRSAPQRDFDNMYGGDSRDDS